MRNWLADYLILALILDSQVGLKGRILTGSSIRRALVREARKLAAAALLVGIDKHSAFGYNQEGPLVLVVFACFCFMINSKTDF